MPNVALYQTPFRSAGELYRNADASRPHYGAANCNPQVAWRSMLHNHVDQADPTTSWSTSQSNQKLRFL